MSSLPRDGRGGWISRALRGMIHRDPRRIFRPVLLCLEPRALLSSMPAVPTNEEQYMLQLINRARANPPAEAARIVALTQTDSTLQSATVDGKTALSVQSLCQNAGVYKYSVDGDRVYAYLNGAWKVSLDSPVVEGHTWSDGFHNYKWESKGSVTTPAGTFADCWSATTVASYNSYILLCRGVGPVKWHYEDGLGNGYEAIMTSKNF